MTIIGKRLFAKMGPATESKWAIFSDLKARFFLPGSAETRIEIENGAEPTETHGRVPLASIF